MKKAALLIFALLLLALPASAQQTHFFEAVNWIIESAKLHDLTPGNMMIEANDGGEIDKDDAKFIGLLGAKLRIARIIKTLGYTSEGSSTLDLLKFLAVLGGSGSMDMAKAPFNLSDYVVFQVILPLKLEPVIRELPVYYDAIVSVPDWQEKLEAIRRIIRNAGEGISKDELEELAMEKGIKEHELETALGRLRERGEIFETRGKLRAVAA